MNIRINKLTTFVLILAFGTVTANADPQLGPDGHFYEVVAYPPGTPNSAKNWDDAKTAADAMIHLGIVGHLATITSADEDLFIHNLRIATGLSNEAWVGGMQPPLNLTGVGWVWENGEGAIPTPQVPVPGKYSNWLPNEPNDNTGAGSENHLAVGLRNDQRWNDEGNFGNIGGFVVEYDSATETFVDPGEDQLIFAGANVPGSENPLTAGYQEVLEGGPVTIDCCRVEDDREIAGKHRKWWQPWYGNHPTGRLDIGAAVADIGNNPSCVDMPAIDPGTAILRRWQRGVPASRGIDDPGSSLVAREHDIGVCLIQADVLSKGVVFSAEETANVLGYSVDCAEKKIKYRPFTGGVSTDPTEVDFPFVTPWTADCDASRSAKRYSDNVMLLNLRHDPKRNPTWLYLTGLDVRLLQSIRQVKLEGCVDNSEGFLDDLRVLVRRAAWDILRFRGNAAVEKLDEATLLALLSPASSTASMLTVDPYAPGGPGTECPGNPKGLLVGRLMSLKFATCSELVQRGPGENAKSPGACEIDAAVFAEMPPLPGFP